MKEWINHIKENPKDILPFIGVCLVCVLLCWLGHLAINSNKKVESTKVIVGSYYYNGHHYLAFWRDSYRPYTLDVIHDPDCVCWTLDN